MTVALMAAAPNCGGGQKGSGASASGTSGGSGATATASSSNSGSYSDTSSGAWSGGCGVDPGPFPAPQTPAPQMAETQTPGCGVGGTVFEFPRSEVFYLAQGLEWSKPFVAQSFVAQTDMRLARVLIKVGYGAYGARPQFVTVTINEEQPGGCYKDSPCPKPVALAASQVPGTKLQAFDPAWMNNDAAPYTQFNFAQPADLRAGARYWIVVDPKVDAGSEVYVGFGINDPYPDQQGGTSTLWYNTYQTYWWAAYHQDMAFRMEKCN